MKLPLKNIVWKENEFYVAQCLNVEVSSFGHTKDEALKNLKEALDLYFEDMTADDALKIEQVEIILQKNNFGFISQNGSHIKYRKIGNPTLTVIIPADRKQIPLGTFHSILKQANLSKRRFRKIKEYFYLNKRRLQYIFLLYKILFTTLSLTFAAGILSCNMLSR